MFTAKISEKVQPDRLKLREEELKKVWEGFGWFFQIRYNLMNLLVNNEVTSNSDSTNHFIR